jgi:hypothetical protein
MENNCEVKPTTRTIKVFYKSRHFWKSFIAISIGGIAGFLYYYFVGCSSGTCAITSNPYLSIILGGLFGYFLINSPCTNGKC